MLRDEFIPYFKSNYSDEEQEKILLAIRVALSDSNFNGFESVFSGCLANDIAPKNRRDFFLWFWEELRPGGEYFLSNWRDYEWGIIF